MDSMNSYWYSFGLIVMLPLAATAQVVADNTIGSQVIQNIQINNVLSDRIDAGQQRGNNLFHCRA